MHGVCLLAIVVPQNVLQYDAVTQQLTGVDQLLLVGARFPGVHLGQVSLKPSNGPRGFAFDGLVLELLVRGFHYERNIHVHDAISYSSGSRHHSGGRYVAKRVSFSEDESLTLSGSRWSFR